MKTVLFLLALCVIKSLVAEDVRLLDLEPPNAQQIIEKQDQSLHYAPKVDSNVPAVRYLGREPHDVQEDIYLARQYHGQDGVGGYLYGYNIPDIAKTEKKVAGGDLTGAYNYIAQDGQEIKVQYWDDGTGFHQIDNVPKILPKQIEDSPEVKAEKEKFLARWHEEAERNQHPVADPYDSNGNYASGPLSPQGQQESSQKYQYSGQYQPSVANYNQYSGSSYQQPGQYNQYSSSSQQQPGQYNQYSSSSQQKPSSYQQPGQYNQYSSSSQQKPNSYQQPGQYSSSSQQQPGQYNQYSSSSEQGSSYQQPGQYQHTQGLRQFGQSGQNPTVSQYQGSQQFGQNQQTGQYHGEPNNEINYEGQYSENQNSYSNPDDQTYKQSSYSQTSQGQLGQYGQYDNSGQYDKKSEEENGPPKGFFYSYDYPVGKIVSVGGIARSTDVKSAYIKNKSEYESQLRAGRSNNGENQSSYSVAQ